MTATTSKSNAETQTALRGVAMLEVVHGGGVGGGSEADPEMVGASGAGGAGGVGDVAVVTRILEDIRHQQQNAAIFFTECECSADATDNQKSEEKKSEEAVVVEVTAVKQGEAKEENKKNKK